MVRYMYGAPTVFRDDRKIGVVKCEESKEINFDKLKKLRFIQSLSIWKLIKLTTNLKGKATFEAHFHVLPLASYSWLW